MLDRPGVSPEESLRETTEAWLDSVRRGAGQAVGGGIVAAFCGRQPLAQSVRHLLAFCDLQRQRDGHGRTAGAFGRGAAPANFRIDAGRLAPRNAVVGGRDVVEAIFAFDTVNGPGYGAIRLLRAADGAARAWTISTSLDFDAICARARAARRDIPRPGFRRPRLARAAAGLRRPMTTAIPMCSLSAAAMPAFRWRSKRSVSGSPRW